MGEFDNLHESTMRDMDSGATIQGEIMNNRVTSQGSNLKKVPVTPQLRNLLTHCFS